MLLKFQNNVGENKLGANKLGQFLKIADWNYFGYY